MSGVSIVGNNYNEISTFKSTANEGGGGGGQRFEIKFLASFSFHNIQDTSVISCVALQFSDVVESWMN